MSPLPTHSLLLMVGKRRRASSPWVSPPPPPLQTAASQPCFLPPNISAILITCRRSHCAARPRPNARWLYFLLTFDIRLDLLLFPLFPVIYALLHFFFLLLMMSDRREASRSLTLVLIGTEAPPTWCSNILIARVNYSDKLVRRRWNAVKWGCFKQRLNWAAQLGTNEAYSELWIMQSYPRIKIWSWK